MASTALLQSCPIALTCAFVGRVAPPDGGRHVQSQMLLTTKQEGVMALQTTV